MHRELPNHLNKIFEPKAPIKVEDLNDLNIEAKLSETFTTTEITVTGGDQSGAKKGGVGSSGGANDPSTPNPGGLQKYTLIPKAVLSLKVLQELPMIVVLMYHLYKQVSSHALCPVLDKTSMGAKCDNEKWAFEVFLSFDKN